MATAVIEPLLTAEEFRRLPEDGRPKELKRGRVILTNLPAPRHDQICGQVYYLLRQHLGTHPLGHLVKAAAIEYGRIFTELKRMGRPMQQVDVQIAAVAFALGNCTVVSADSDLADVPGLTVENWAS